MRSNNTSIYQISFLVDVIDKLQVIFLCPYKVICPFHRWYIYSLSSGRCGSNCEGIISKLIKQNNPNSKCRGANMEPTWVLSAPGGPHVGPINLAIREILVVKLPSGERHAISSKKILCRFSQWFDAVRCESITLANIDRDQRCHMTVPGHNDLKQ